MKKIILDQAKIAYFRKGKIGKPKILMLHGIFTSSCFFEETAEFLKKDFDILAPDFPGFGHSDKLKSLPHNLDTFADIVRKLCDHLDFANFTLVGGSLGALTGIVFTSKYPEYVEKLILQAPPWHHSCINSNWELKMFDVLSHLKPAAKVAGKMKGVISQKMLSNVFKVFNKHYLEIDRRNGKVFFSFNTMNLEATRDVWHCVRKLDLTNEAKSIRQKTLIISGDHDEQVKPSCVKKLTKLIKNSEFKLIRGWDCTHALFFDHPEKMAGVVREFLKG
jgi:pimeloyl-ACP methyl ester carboxylesterase